MRERARDIWEPLAGKIRARTELEPDAYALAVYDAVWVVARGYVASGATLGIEELKRAFTTAAATGFGATGWMPGCKPGKEVQRLLSEHAPLYLHR